MNVGAAGGNRAFKSDAGGGPAAPGVLGAACGGRWRRERGWQQRTAKQGKDHGPILTAVAPAMHGLL